LLQFRIILKTFAKSEIQNPSIIIFSENNIEIDYKEIGGFGLALDGFWTLMNAAVNLRVPLMAERLSVSRKYSTP
jgi:hypothetical protein